MNLRLVKDIKFLEGSMKHSPYTLIVIDVQEGFTQLLQPRVAARFLTAVRAQVVQAIRDNADIVIVEYDDEEFGATHKNLKRLACNHLNHTFVYKWDNDGSSQIIKALRESEFNTKRFKVVGLNTEACVRETVEGLHKELPSARLEVIQNACETANPIKDPWSSYMVSERIHLIPV